MAKLTKSEIEDLKSIGYDVETANPVTLPDNLSPILRDKVLQDWKDRQDRHVGVEDLPTAVDRQNERVRERAAADGDKAMQEYLGVDESGEAKADPLDHDGNGRRGGAKKPSATK